MADADYTTITSGDVIKAAKDSLNAIPTLVVVGKTAGAHSHATITKLLK